MTQKKRFLRWIESAKREETKLDRVLKAFELLENKKSMSDYFYGRQTSAARGRGSVSFLALHNIYIRICGLLDYWEG